MRQPEDCLAGRTSLEACGNCAGMRKHLGKRKMREKLSWSLGGWESGDEVRFVGVNWRWSKWKMMLKRRKMKWPHWLV